MSRRAFASPGTAMARSAGSRRGGDSVCVPSLIETPLALAPVECCDRARFDHFPRWRSSHKSVISKTVVRKTRKPKSTSKKSAPRRDAATPDLFDGKTGKGNGGDGY